VEEKRVDYMEKLFYMSLKPSESGRERQCKRKNAGKTDNEHLGEDPSESN